MSSYGVAWGSFGIRFLLTVYEKILIIISFDALFAGSLWGRDLNKGLIIDSSCYAREERLSARLLSAAGVLFFNEPDEYLFMPFKIRYLPYIHKDMQGKISTRQN